MSVALLERRRLDHYLDVMSTSTPGLPTPPTNDFDKSLVDHAVRCWDAERENAARLSARGTLMLSAVAALFGLGLFRIEWFRGVNDQDRIRWIWSIWAIKGFLIFAVLAFALAFWYTLRSTRKGVGRKVGNSSDLLGFPKSIATNPPPTEDLARRLVFKCVYRAYLDLSTRNQEKKRRQDQGQQFFFVGLFLVAMAIVLYILCSEPPRI